MRFTWYYAGYRFFRDIYLFEKLEEESCIVVYTCHIRATHVISNNRNEILFLYIDFSILLYNLNS